MTTQDIRIIFSGQDVSASATADRVAGSMNRVNKAAKEQERLMANLIPQFNDIAVSLAGGQNPLMVFLQQGTQMRDMAGGLTPLMAALSATFTPMVLGATAAAAAVGTLGAAWYQGMQQSAEFRDAVALTGGAAGVTEGAFNALIDTTAKASDATVGGAREIAQGLLSTGRIGGEAIESLTTAALRFQAVTGKTAEEAISKFGDMANGVTEWAERHNKAWHFATADQLEYIRTLEETGRQQEAMVETGRLVVEHLKGQAENLGYVERAYKDAAQAGARYKEMLLGIGREETPQERLLKAQRELAEQRDIARKQGISDEPFAAYTLRQLENKVTDAQNEVNEAEGIAKLQKQGAEQEADRSERLKTLRRLTADVSGANKEYIKTLEDIQRLASPGKFGEAPLIDEPQRVALVIQAAEKYGPKQQAPGKVVEPFDPMAFSLNFGQDQAEKLYDAQTKQLSREMADTAARETAIASADAAASQNRRRQAERLADDLLDANQRLSIDLIADDRARGQAQIEAYRQEIQQRIDIARSYGIDVEESQSALDANIVLRQKGLTEQLKPEWQRMVEHWADAQARMNETWQQGMADMLKGTSDAFGQWAAGMNVNIESLARSFVARMASTLFNAMASQALMSLFPSMFPGAGGAGGETPAGSKFQAPPGFSFGPVGLSHKGGVIGAGETSGSRMLPLSLFNSAPRYHGGGIAANEVPAVLLKGEGVFTQGQMKALGAGIGGKSAGRGSTINQTVNISVDSRADRAETASAIQRAMAETRKQTIADLRSLGLLKS